MSKKKILVTAALPYANGAIHFGHLAGAYLPADCYTRFHRLQGNDVRYICGSDEYGVAISMSAELAGRSPKEHVDHFHAVNKALFEAVGISFDHYSRTTWPGHDETAIEFFEILLKKGYIEPRDSARLFCEKDGKFYADRYVIGTCPHCGYERARGDECTACGSSYEAEELKDPKTKIGEKKLSLKETKHWYLRLDLFKEQLLSWLETKGWKSNVVKFVKHYIEHLRPRAITRDMKWGIPVPLSDAVGKVFYVWFDAPIGYISSMKEWSQQIGDPEAWKSYWLDPETHFVQFIGKDNIPFHAVIFPAMLMGQDVSYKLVDELPANEFYNLEGKQFSKSEGWYVDLAEFLETYSADQLRYTIAANLPETQDSEFSWPDFQNRCNSELLGKFGNFVHRTLVFARNKCGGCVPAIETLSSEDEAFLQKCKDLVEQIEGAYSSFKLRRACQLIMELAQAGNGYFDAKKPWNDAKEEKRHPSMRATISCCLESIKLLSLVASPVLPYTCEQIIEQLGLGKEFLDLTWKERSAYRLPEGHKLGESRLLFRKIEDDEIEKQEAKLRFDEKGDEISIEDFRRSKLEVVEVLSATQVEKSDKLLCLQVQTSVGSKQIVSGIAQWYKPESLVGRRLVACVNLVSCKLRGVESQGMILMATKPDGSPEFLEVREAPAGSIIE